MRHEPLIRFGFFLGVLVLIALWERLAPRRKLMVRISTRWLSNLGLVALNTLAVRGASSLGAVGVALVSDEHDMHRLRGKESAQITADRPRAHDAHAQGTHNRPRR